MENTRTNKKIYLAQHWNQFGFVKNHVAREDGSMKPINEYRIDEIEYVELKSLSQLTEEDAKHLMINKCVVDGHKAEELGFKRVTISFDGSSMYKLYIECEMTSTKWQNWMERLFINSDNLKTFESDYLRSKGYAIEFNGLSIEELKNRGWLKIKE